MLIFKTDFSFLIVITHDDLVGMILVSSPCSFENDVLAFYIPKASFDAVCGVVESSEVEWFG